VPSHETSVRAEFEKWATQRGLDENGWDGVGALKDWEVDRARAWNIWSQGYAAGMARMREMAAAEIEDNSCGRHCTLCNRAPCGKTAAEQIRVLPAAPGAEGEK